MPDTFYITTAIDYTNAAPHIGHAYEKVLADVIARYHRLKGENVYFLTGVDQHGQKVQQAAEKEGVSPLEYAQRTSQKFLDTWEKLDIKPDGWASTTDERHKTAVQKILQALYEKGEIYKAKHAGFYSVRQEQFLTDKERGPDGNFGPEWGEVVYIEEENWYFKLSIYRDWLIQFVEKNTEFVFPAFRRNELLNAVEKLAGDLCISRPKERLSWGIELPFDRDYVTYVWFDALINYISFAGYKAEAASGLPDFKSLWPCAAHVIGKDIMVPSHGVYWPIMLHALGFSDDEIPPLLVHGWWNLSGAKISKSLGNVIDPDFLAGKYGSDGVRFYLMRDIATGQDADFNEERLQGRYNADLANDLGNLLNRSLNMSHRYRGGVLKKGDDSAPEFAALRETIKTSIEIYKKKLDGYEPHTALEALWQSVSHCNAFVEATAPWKLAKDPEAAGKLDAVLYHLAETLRILAVLISPVLTKASATMQAQLQVESKLLLEETAWGGLQEGHQLGSPVPLFPRLEVADQK